MTSGGNNCNYFPENQLTKFSAVLQFKHSEKMSLVLSPPNFLIFVPPRGFLWRILRRRGCLWTPLLRTRHRFFFVCCICAFFIIVDEWLRLGAFLLFFTAAYRAFDWSTSVTDRRTDRRTGDSIARYSIICCRALRILPSDILVRDTISLIMISQISLLSRTHTPHSNMYNMYCNL